MADQQSSPPARSPSSDHSKITLSITGPQRASGGHQGWTNVGWAQVSYRGQLGQYRVTIDTSGWPDGESSRNFQLVANNDAGQTTQLVSAIISTPLTATPPPSVAPTPAATPVTEPTPVMPTSSDPASAATIAGVNGRPTLTAQTRIEVRRATANNVSEFSISGPVRSDGGYQAWTNQSWATVAYAGIHGNYRVTIDTNGWAGTESKRNFILTSNNDTGQTTIPVEAIIASAPATPSAPAPTTTPEQSDIPGVAETLNSVATIIGDMGLPNDGVLDGIPDFFWATNKLPAQIAMGADSRGCHAPQWWQNLASVRAAYKDCEYWTAFVQWFVIFEGQGNAANNVRVESRNPRTWYLSKSTGQWKLLGQDATTSWFLATKSDLVYTPGGVDAAVSPDGATSLLVTRGAPHSYHGVWPQGVIDIAGVAHDIGALYTTVEARLVVNDAAQPDDRDRALWLWQSGADFYPGVGVPVYDAVPPGAGLSRSKKITAQWQSFNFATISNARVDYQGPVQPLSLEEFRGNPPPLD